MDTVTVTTQGVLEESQNTEDVSRTVVFETADTTVVQSRVAGGVTTGWHHNGDRHVYGYVVSGHALLEYGVAGGTSVELSAGDFVYVPPRTIRRVVNATDEDWVVVLSFVGTGPIAVPTEGPLSEST